MNTLKETEVKTPLMGVKTNLDQILNIFMDILTPFILRKKYTKTDLLANGIILFF